MTDIVERLEHSPRWADECQCHKLTREAADEIEGLRTDVEAYRIAKFRDNDEMAELRAKVERLTNAIRRIDGLNDNPANYSPAINAVCDAILRAALEPKP